MQGAQINWLPDGWRLHLHHGPIDMIVAIEGPGREAAFSRAAQRFETLLGELVEELPRLRALSGELPKGETARIMSSAVALFAPAFITPMAAVAGAGADTILRAILEGSGIEKAYVNNGGDVAFHVEPGEVMRAAIAGAPPGHVSLRASDPVRGVATSGAGGRSYSLGIAESVTVLAKTAAMADAAATMVANAVDLPGHPAIQRLPARELSPESDLASRLVTRQVGNLRPAEVESALDSGKKFAADLCARGVIHAAFLTLQGQTCSVGPLPLIQKKEAEHA